MSIIPDDIKVRKLTPKEQAEWEVIMSLPFTRIDGGALSYEKLEDSEDSP